MKVILPLAGKGTRLLPLTKHLPKPLVPVGGRPVLDYVMEEVNRLDVDELLIITGHLKEQVEAFVTAHYSQPARFIEQRVQDGTAGAVHLARAHVDGPVLIIFVDTLFDADLTVIQRTEADGIIWTKEVEDYQRFGVVVTDEQGFMRRIVEKPSEPISRLANIGLYYIRDWEMLYEGIEHTLAQPPHGGEWYLTDAFQYMIDHDRQIRAAEVSGWYDCGKVETLLETNLHLLKRGRGRTPAPSAGVTVSEPVRVADGVVLEDCTIGPNVTLGEGAEVRSSVLRHAVVGARTKIVRSEIEHAVIGDDTTLHDIRRTWVVAAGNEMAPAP